MMAATEVRRGSLFILLAALIWSTGGFFIKSVSLDAFGVSFWRSSFAAVTLFAIYRWKYSSISHAEEEPWLHRHTLLIAGTYATLLVLFVLATKLTTSANAIFLQYTAPIYVLIVEPMMTHSKRKRSDLVMVVLCTLAMGLFFIGQFEMRSIWGNIFALMSGVSFAAFALLLKHEHASEGTRWRAVIMGHILIAAVMLGLRFAGMTHLMPHGSDLLELGYLGVMQIGIAYALFTFGISHVRAIDATLLSMIEPVLNPVWVFIGLGERPSNYALLGGAIILSLVALRTIAQGREAKA